MDKKYRCIVLRYWVRESICCSSYHKQANHRTLQKYDTQKLSNSSTETSRYSRLMLKIVNSRSKCWEPTESFQLTLQCSWRDMDWERLKSQAQKRDKTCDLSLTCHLLVLNATLFCWNLNIQENTLWFYIRDALFYGILKDNLSKKSKTHLSSLQITIVLGKSYAKEVRCFLGNQRLPTPSHHPSMSTEHDSEISQEKMKARLLP